MKWRSDLTPDLLEEIDEVLRDRNIPICNRPLHAWLEHGKRVPYATGSDLLDLITEWYQEKYGEDALKIRREIGASPVLIEGEIFIARYPVLGGLVGVSLLDFVEGLTPALRRKIAGPEGELLANHLRTGLDAWFELSFFLQAHLSKLTQPAQETFKAAVSDLNAMPRLLLDQRTRDLNGTCVRAEQAAEKFLKFFLIHEGVPERSLRTGGIQHSPPLLLKCCRQINAWFDLLDGLISSTDFHMGLRYGQGKPTKSECVAGCRAALAVGRISAIALSPPGESDFAGRARLPVRL